MKSLKMYIEGLLNKNNKTNTHSTEQIIKDELGGDVELTTKDGHLYLEVSSVNGEMITPDIIRLLARTGTFELGPNATLKTNWVIDGDEEYEGLDVILTPRWIGMQCKKTGGIPTFKNCKFSTNPGDEYLEIQPAAKDWFFEDCTFNCRLDISSSKVSSVRFKDCIFLNPDGAFLATDKYHKIGFIDPYMKKLMMKYVKKQPASTDEVKKAVGIKSTISSWTIATKNYLLGYNARTKNIRAKNEKTGEIIWTMPCNMA